MQCLPGCHSFHHHPLFSAQPTPSCHLIPSDTPRGEPDPISCHLPTRRDPLRSRPALPNPRTTLPDPPFPALPNQEALYLSYPVRLVPPCRPSSYYTLVVQERKPVAVHGRCPTGVAGRMAAPLSRVRAIRRGGEDFSSVTW